MGTGGGEWASREGHGANRRAHLADRLEHERLLCGRGVVAVDGRHGPRLVGLEGARLAHHGRHVELVELGDRFDEVVEDLVDCEKEVLRR